MVCVFYYYKFDVSIQLNKRCIYQTTLVQGCAGGLTTGLWCPNECQRSCTKQLTLLPYYTYSNNSTICARFLNCPRCFIQYLFKTPKFIYINKSHNCPVIGTSSVMAVVKEISKTMKDTRTLSHSNSRGIYQHQQIINHNSS